jgi:ADP-ribosylglycohydrolase
MSIQKENIYGCLIGVAAGDAMGMPSSMMSPDTIKSVFKETIEDFLPAPDGHVIHQNMVAGQITDDTQQTIILADSLIEKRCIDPQDIAWRLIQWAESIGAFESLVLGPSTLRSLHAIRSGRPIGETGSVGDTNGAAMKISPAGIYGKGDLERTVEAVSKVCLPTHNTNVAIAGASAVAMAIGCGISGEKDIDTILEKSLQAVQLGMTCGRIWYGASITKRTRLALSILSENKQEKQIMRSLYEVIGAGVAMTETVPLCLAVVKMAKGDPVKAIRITTNLGGDCDTTSSIVGAICGAISGAQAFPEHWIKKLENVNQLNLENYANKLYKLINES